MVVTTHRMSPGIREIVIVLSMVVVLIVVSHNPKPSDNPQVIKKVENIIEPITDEELSTLYTLREDVKNDACLEISVEDADRLMRIAVVEDNTNAESQAYVMAVILNRLASDEFPNTIEDVINQYSIKDGKKIYQFSTVSNGSYKNAIPDVNSHLALAMIESGEIKTDALFFEASWAKNTWQSEHRTYLCTVGGTKYYK